MELGEFEALASKLLAAEFWRNGVISAKYPLLAPIAAKITAAPCVSSQVERYFSQVGNTWTTTRNALSTKRASLFSTASYHLNAKTCKEPRSEGEKLAVQKRLLAFVQKVEDSLTSTPEINEPGLSNLDEFLDGFLSSNGMIYTDSDDDDQPESRVEVEEGRRSTLSFSNSGLANTTSTSSSSVLVTSSSQSRNDQKSLLEEFQEMKATLEPESVRRSKRQRKPSTKAALALAHAQAPPSTESPASQEFYL